MPSHMVHIYGLSDPRDGSIHYVGQTTQPPERRLGQHLAKSQLDRPHEKGVWLRELISLGLSPQIQVFETVPPELAGDTEWKWIRYYGLAGIIHRGHRPSRTAPVVNALWREYDQECMKLLHICKDRMDEYFRQREALQRQYWTRICEARQRICDED